MMALPKGPGFTLQVRRSPARKPSPGFSLQSLTLDMAYFHSSVFYRSCAKKSFYLKQKTNMPPDKIFQLVNLLALIGWVLMLLSNIIKTENIIVGIIVTLLAIVYSWLIFSHFKPAGASGFSTLDGVIKLFSSKPLVLAGWVHYLAFDLMTGLFICANSRKHNINFWLIIPCLFFTFMLGPFGLLLYLLIRLIVTKKYFSANF